MLLKEKFLHLLERKAISIILGITYAFMSERRYKEYGLEIFTKVVRKTKVCECLCVYALRPFQVVALQAFSQ